MNGLINQTQLQPTQTKPINQYQSGSVRFKDSSLQQIADGIQAKIPQQFMQQFLAIEKSGMQVMFSAETHHIMKRYVDPKDIVGTVSHSIAMLLAYIYKESGRKMNIAMAAPAGIVLMCHALDYEEQTGEITLNPDIIAQCVHQTALASLKMFGIGQTQIDSVVQKGRAAQQVQQNQQGAM